MNWWQWSMLTVIVFFRTAGVWSGCVKQPTCASCTVSILSCDNQPFGPNLSSDEFAEESYYTIQSLKLNNSRIENLRTGVFDDMRQLQVLSLSHNSIRNINCCVFSTLTILRELILSNNNIISIDGRSFEKLLKLETLDLSYNHLTSLGNGKLFKNLKALRVLNVSHNKLSVLCKKIFLSQRNLSTLHLSFNDLSGLQAAVLYPMDSLTTLSLQGNSLKCDCDLRETILWCDAHNLELNIVCRDNTGHRAPLKVARNLTECDKSSVPDKSVASSSEFIILAVLLTILIFCVCVYFGTRAWKKTSSSTTGTKRSNTKPENNPLSSEDNVYEYMPPPLYSYSYAYSLDYPALPPRPTLIADSGEDNGPYEGPSNNSSGNHETKTHSSNDKVTFVEHDEMIDYRRKNAIHMSSDYATPKDDESNNTSNQHYASSNEHSGKQVSAHGLMKSNSMYCECD